MTFAKYQQGMFRGGTCQRRYNIVCLFHWKMHFSINVRICPAGESERAVRCCSQGSNLNITRAKINVLGENFSNG